jgi:hypothetical protein
LIRVFVILFVLFVLFILFVFVFVVVEGINGIGGRGRDDFRGTRSGEDLLSRDFSLEGDEVRESEVAAN